MAIIDVPHRNYKMTDADLCMFTSNLVNDLTLDLTELTPFGVTAPKIAALKALGDAFEIMPTDIEIEAAVMEATLAKNDLMAQLKEGIRNLALRVELKWGVDSIKYKTLKLTGMNNIADNDLIFVARRVLRMLTIYLPDLAAEGLTQVMLDDFGDLINGFEEAKNLQHDKTDERMEASMVRLNAGNEIYEQVVRYCEIGKRVFVNSNPVRYNCYVIYTTSSGSLTAPTNLTFYFPTKTFSWDMVNNATSYSLEYSVDGDEANYVEIFSGTETSYVYTPPVEGWSFFRVRCRSAAGYSEYSQVLKQGYFAVLPPPLIVGVDLVPNTTNSVRLVWNEVASTTKYRVYRSTVNIGDPAGSWVLVSQESGTSLIETVSEGKRYYYRLTAENAYQASVVSSNVFVDVPVAP